MRSYGWILLLLLGLTAAVAVRFVSMVRESHTHPRIGDGTHPSTYGFDLENLTVPRAQLTAHGLPRDGIRALSFPEIYTAEKATSFRGRNKYLVPTDLVIGVWVNGKPRAYPLQILNWHEVVNDTLGGSPIVVSYSPLAGIATAYERHLGGETDSNPVEAPEFGVSGLFWNGHHLLYNRREAMSGESLWSPLLGRAIAGPAVETQRPLTALPAALVPWKLWQSQFPTTTVLGRDEMQLARYKRKPYVSYFGNDEVRFPVPPLPPRSERKWKTRTVIPVLDPGSDRGLTALTVPGLSRQTTGDANEVELNLNSVRIRVLLSENPPAAMVVDLETGQPLPARNAFWFAWYATYPGGPVQ